MPFLWSSHPLFAVRPGMRLELPLATMRVFSAPAFPARHGDVVSWPRCHGLDLSYVPQPDGGIGAKLLALILTEGSAELSDPADGSAFRFEFDPTLVTHFGLWVNYCGWAAAPDAAPCFNLGLEPCIGAPDTLDTAVRHWREYGELPPRSSRAWWLRIALS